MLRTLPKNLRERIFSTYESAEERGNLKRFATASNYPNETDLGMWWAHMGRNCFMLKRCGRAYTEKVFNTHRSPIRYRPSSGEETKLLLRNCMRSAIITATAYTTKLLLLEIVTTT